MPTRSIAQLKAWFRRGKYPTEEQFADWLDSYVHKEESKLPIAQVEELPEQLNGKYAATAGRELERQYRELKSDYDANKRSSAEQFDNIAENIEELEAADERQQEEINTANANLEHLRKRLHPTAVFGSLDSMFSALGTNYNTLWALGNTLKTFLEAEDTADRTINRWKEIETFLQGITDTQTLSGLMQVLEKRIIDTCKTDTGSKTEQLRAELEAVRKKLDEFIGFTYIDSVEIPARGGDVRVGVVTTNKEWEVS